MKIKTKLIILLGLIFFIHSCTENEFEGPSIENLYGDFEINEPLKITNKKGREKIYFPPIASNVAKITER